MDGHSEGVQKMGQRLLSLLLGSALSAVGLVFLWHGMPHSASVVCQRSPEKEMDCQQQAKILWFIPIETIPLNGLKSARLLKGENAYDGEVFAVALTGRNGELIFGNSLDREEVEADLSKVKVFLKDASLSTLNLNRYQAEWLFVLLGLPIAALGFWTIFWAVTADLSQSGNDKSLG
ncbi:MAG TPA: hypothetical protein IGS53_03445 [Leptolyngbyaceae cyanobacterium M33_DOE_097]|uniref:Uncharacterized protein n=1 Tax=Oscillatoriales cyanobacterium SpSt-418 TaxID=2282169 RepID=A0A7C3KFB4_9CYAN|nr:hypothetical protein [Leptolyngbyaceae cyanobacterium M33_DOE_097]